MFNVGDYIVYPMYGAGIITDIVEKDFLGESRTHVWRLLSPLTTARSSVSEL